MFNNSTYQVFTIRFYRILRNEHRVYSKLPNEMINTGVKMNLQPEWNKGGMYNNACFEFQRQRSFKTISYHKLFAIIVEKDSRP